MHKLSSIFCKISKKSKNSSGFTLTELLIVIIIIGVLAGAIITLINPITQFNKARDAQRVSDAREIQGALEMYRAQFDGYPQNLPACGGLFAADNSGNLVTSGATVTFLQTLPCDPTTSNAYSYLACGTSFSNSHSVNVYPQYEIGVCFEGTTSPDPKASQTPPYPPLSCVGTPPSCGGSAYYYWSP